MTFQEQLEGMNACRDARSWAGGKTLEQAWATCEQADWMLWYAARRGVPDYIIYFAVSNCLKLTKPNDNVFAQAGFKDAHSYLAEVWQDRTRAEFAVYTALRCCWGRPAYPAEGYEVSDDDGCYSADRTALSKQFADIVRKHITVDMFREPR